MIGNNSLERMQINKIDHKNAKSPISSGERFSQKTVTTNVKQGAKLFADATSASLAPKFAFFWR